MRILKAQGLGGALRVRGDQERDVAGQGLRGVLGGQGGRGAARQGAGARGRAARHPLEHREPRRRLPRFEALVGGHPPRARARRRASRSSSSRTSTASATSSARPILPEDVAEAVLFLASDRSAKTTGCTHHGRRRRQGRLPAVSRACIGFGAFTLAAPAGGAVRARAARRGARLRLRVDAATTSRSTTRSTSRSPCWRRTRRSPGGSSSARRLSPRAPPPDDGGQDHRRRSTRSPAGGSSSASAWAARTRRSSRRAACPHKERGARVTEGIDVVRALWRDSPATFKGRFTQFEGVCIDPKPVQQPGAADLDRRPLRRGARPRGPPGRRLDVLRRAGRALRAEPRQDPRRRGGRGPLARRLRRAHLTFITVGRDYETARASVGARLEPRGTPRTSRRSRGSTASSARPSSASSSSSASSRRAARYFLMSAIVRRRATSASSSRPSPRRSCRSWRAHSGHSRSAEPTWALDEGVRLPRPGERAVRRHVVSVLSRPARLPRVPLRPRRPAHAWLLRRAHRRVAERDGRAPRAPGLSPQARRAQPRRVSRAGARRR